MCFTDFMCTFKSSACYDERDLNTDLAPDFALCNLGLSEMTCGRHYSLCSGWKINYFVKIAVRVEWMINFQFKLIYCSNVLLNSKIHSC